MKEDDINSMKADDINSAKLKNLQKKAITVREAVVRNWNKQKMTIQKKHPYSVYCNKRNNYNEKFLTDFKACLLFVKENVSCMAWVYENEISKIINFWKWSHHTYSEIR